MKERDYQAADRDFFDSVRADMLEIVATLAIYKLCNYLCRYYGKVHYPAG